MSQTSDVRFYISSATVPVTEVFPVFDGLMRWEKENGKLYYRLQIENALKFKNQDYTILTAFENSECESINLFIDIWENEAYTRFWEGTFTLFGNSQDYDKCFFEIKAEAADGYDCLEAALKKTQETFTYGSVTSVVSVAGEIEEQICEGAREGRFPYEPADSSCLTNPANWCLKSHVVTIIDQEQPDESVIELTRWVTTWHREKLTTNCENGAPVAPGVASGWSLLENNCGVDGTAVYWRCPSNSNNQVLGPYPNGRKWSEFLPSFFSAMNCGFVIKSDFFGINAVGDAPDNSFYQYAEDNLRHLTIHQKSDIKDKNASNPSEAPAWEMKAEDLISDLATIFNVYIALEGSTVIVEHFSFFTANGNYDFSAAPMTKRVNRSPSSDANEETFYAMDRYGTEGFAKGLIEYPCGKEPQERPVKLFSFDLGYIEDETKAENISNDGFVLIANEQYEGNLIIKDGNSPLSWAALLPNLHTQGRLFRSGSIDGTPFNFENWLPYREQEPFTVSFEELSTFDPNHSVTTPLGTGQQASAQINLFTKRIVLEISY